jgi:PTS system nitrogen regulatory IIA component
MAKITRYLDPSLICLLDVKSRDEAIQSMVDLADGVGKIHGKEPFIRAILDREHVVSTGIGMGVAIPHAKLPNYDGFFIVIGILQQGVDWNSLDKNPVRLIFMIGGPDDRQTEYLQILSQLTMAIKNEETRKRLLRLTSPGEIIELFESY